MWMTNWHKYYQGCINLTDQQVYCRQALQASQRSQGHHPVYCTLPEKLKSADLFRVYTVTVSSPEWLDSLGCAHGWSQSGIFN